MKKLAIITTHPIQYYAPVFQLLSERGNIALKVFYTWGRDAQHKYDPGFGKPINWDIPLLNGYSYEWLENTAKQPGSHHFDGIVNPDIITRIEAYEPDAILVFGWAYQGHLKALRYFKGKIPVLFRGDSVLLKRNNLLIKTLRYLRLRWIYQYIDHAFYVGTNNKRYFLKYGLKEDQLTFAPHAVDNERFMQPEPTIDIKRELGIADEYIVILFAGKLEIVKSPLLLLTAFLKLKQSNTHLIFAGDGELEPELKRVAGAAKNVHFLGFKNQAVMPAIYQACNLFCLPSLSETWGLAVNEAMACGKAILVSNKVGCAVDLVKPNENGIIFKSEDADDLLLSLKKLTQSKDLLSLYGRQSKAIIASWNFEQIALAIEKHLNETH
jgi:glycosyltransferase involved in cell wall biosynthesis